MFVKQKSQILTIQQITIYLNNVIYVKINEMKCVYAKTIFTIKYNILQGLDAKFTRP